MTIDRGTLFQFFKYAVYALLTLNFWDAFLWLVAFFFIEMNVVEWRQESLEGQVGI